MKNEELIKGLSEELKAKLAACKTQEGVRKILEEAGIEALDDKLLEAVSAGAGYRPRFICEPVQG